MYRIIDGRGTGKTCKLMLLAKETNSIVACSNPEAMRDKAYNYNIVGVDFISYNDFFDGNYDTERDVMIDEIEIFIRRACAPNKIVGYTLSNED